MLQVHPPLFKDALNELYPVSVVSNVSNRTAFLRVCQQKAIISFLSVFSLTLHALSIGLIYLIC